MTNQMNAKVRLVRCPGCRQVLPEMPDIPVYKCGGCGTVLKAKIRKPDTECTGLRSGETGENEKKEPDDAPEKKEIGHLNQECVVSSKGKFPADTSPSRSDDNSGVCNVKQDGEKSLSDELPISPELTCHENEDLSPRLSEQMEQDESKGTLHQDTGYGKNEFSDGYYEWHGGRSSSDDFPSSMELTYHETEGSSPEPQACTALDEVKYTSEECTRVARTELGNCEREQDESHNFLSNGPSMIEDKPEESDSSPKHGEHGEEDESLHLPQEDTTSNECRIPVNVDCSREISSSTEVTCYKPEKHSAVVEAHVEVDKDLNGHMFESLKAEDNKIEIDSTDAAESPLSEHILLDNIISPDNQHLELSHKIIPHESERATSVDSLDDLPLRNSVSELGLKHTDLSKSPTRSYYGYDGSVSSYDGNEDQNPGRFLKPANRTFSHSALVSSNVSHKQDESRVKDFLNSKAEMHYQGILETGVDDMLSSESEVRHRARKSLTSQERNHRAIKYTKQSQSDLPDSRSSGHSGGSRMRADQEEYAPRLPFLPRYTLAGQRNEILSSYQYNGLQHYSGFCSPDTPSYAEPDKMELLRMVHELKDELKRMQISNSRSPTRFAREKMHTPLFYDRLAPAQEMYAGLHHSRYPGRCSQVKGLPQLHKMSRMTFSGNAADCRQEVDCSCLYCCPQDWHYSAQLPPHPTHCNNVHFMAQSGQTCYKGPYSTSSSPQHYTSSQFSVRGCETKSDDQRPHSEMKRLHVREKYGLTKRHLRPVAGGIPIVACFHCSELLQLPADFLLSGRRCHQLRCKKCRKIMKFSLQSGRHLIPCIPDAIAPPPSMVGDCGDSIDQRGLVWASHSNKRPHAEPLSCSDDYGLSFDRSCSTDGEPSQNLLPIVPLKSCMQNRKISSGSSFGPLEDRKMKSVLEESQMTQRNSMENFGSAGPSTKASKWGMSTSEIEELPPAPGSPLHRLMGYSSPSDVIKP